MKTTICPFCKIDDYNYELLRINKHALNDGIGVIEYKCECLKCGHIFKLHLKIEYNVIEQNSLEL